MIALIVEDSRTSRRFLRSFMEGLSFRVVEAADGNEALEQLAQTGPIDLALVDWHMPGLDGVGFVKRVREDPAHRELPILMVTSRTDMRLVATALEAGVDEYLMKPFTRAALKDKLLLLGAARGRAWQIPSES